MYEDGEKLSQGFKIKTKQNETVLIEKFLGGGGQGDVYSVLYNGRKMALKWYKKSALGGNSEIFYEHIFQNVMQKAPSDEFLWPIDITECMNGTFGYIMDLKPEGYYEMMDYMLCNVRFSSYRVMIDAALHIVSAFRKLHNAGYSYQDLNDGNFFINPNNGKVLICDNDNVAPDGTETGIVGKPRYMAPEIVMKEKMPDSRTDRFSMSVILYILFCLNHPLEGRKYLEPGLTDNLREKLYGSEALFMMDPDDKSNAPHPVIHKNSIIVWNCLPNYIQEIFLDAFSQKSMRKGSARPPEVEWLNRLVRFRSEIVSCSCGNEIFTQQGEPCICEECRRKANIPFKLIFSDYAIPAIRGSRIYRCQIGICDAKEALEPVAQVLQKQESGVLGIKNKSGKRWDAITSKGTVRKVAPNEVIPLKDGVTFSVANETIIIKENR